MAAAKRFFRKKQPNREARIFAFIDSQNLNVSTQKNGWKMDWKKFRIYLTEKHKVTEAYMFIGYMPEHEGMYEQLHDAGFKIVLKQTFDMTRPQAIMSDDPKDKQKAEEELHIKGNVDADLVLWAMKEISNYDKAILVSGDGDFYSLLEHLEEKNKLDRILVPTNHYSSLFNKFEDKIVDLDAQRNELSYRDRSRKHSRNNQRKKR